MVNVMKKWILATGIVAALAALCAACVNRGDTIAQLNGEWNITLVDGKKPDSKVTPWIGFDIAEKRVYGNLGVNHVIGTLDTEVKPGMIDFSQLGLTRMMGAPEAMEVENRVTEALGKVISYRVTDHGNRVDLYDERGTRVLELQRRTDAQGTGKPSAH